MPARRPRPWASALLALCPALPARPQEVDLPAEEMKVRSLLLARYGPWLKDTEARLVERAANPAPVEKAMSDLREEIRRIVGEEVRGSRVGALLKPKAAKPESSPVAADARAAPFEGRFSGKERLRSMHGGTGTEEALLKALDWLARHQAGDGRWDTDGFGEHCAGAKCGGTGLPIYDVGVTGLALLAFLGDGNLPDRGSHAAVVDRATRWLVGRQIGTSGMIGEKFGSGYLYEHAIATVALAEAFALTGSPELRRPVEGAVRFALRARNPDKAWRYEEPPTGENDTSVTSWMVTALRTAEEAGIEVDPKAYEGALAWLDEMTDPKTGRCGYMGKGELSARRTGTEALFPAQKSEALTAAALHCRFLLGQTPEKGPILRRYADRIRKAPPVWEVTPERSLIDEYYWYYGSLAAFRMGGEDWKAWNAAMRKALLEHQRGDGDAAGSWDPVGVWGNDGGRVYMTALCALCLETYYRSPSASR